MALTKIPASLLDTSSGINGLIYPTSDGTSGQFLKTDGSGNLTFATVTTYTDSDVETYLDGGSSTPTFASATVSGTLTVTGDLDITGDINSYNVTDLDVADKTITLGAGQTEANSGGSGIIIDGSSASILWDETNTEWDFNKSINVTGTGQATRLGLGVAPHATAGLNITTTNQHMRLNNGSELGIVHVLSTGELELWGHGDGESINFRTGSGAGTVAMNIIGNNVGITNTSTLNANLHIGSASATGDATNPALQIGGSSTYRLGMYTTSEGGVIDNANGDDGLQFHTKNVGEAVRITANGNLQMIAQTSSFESPGLTYHTNNYLYLRGGSSGLILADDSGINTVQIIDGSAGYINFETGDGSSRMRIDSSGKVGIGNSTPSNNHANANRLVVGNGTAGGIANYVGVGTGWYAFSRDNANNTDAYDGGISYNGDRDLKFHTNAGSTRMTIDGAGNVGIGTTNPSTPLHVYSNTSGVIATISGPNNYNSETGISLAVDRAKISGVLNGSGGSPGASLRFYTQPDSGSLTERMRINSNGVTGFGLTPTGTNVGSIQAAGDITCTDNFSTLGTHLSLVYTAGTGQEMHISRSNGNRVATFTEGQNLLLGDITSNYLTYGALQVARGGYTAGFGGIVGFFDTDVSVGSSNLIQVISFSGDTDATGGVFTRYRDSNSVLGQVTAANGTQCSYGVTSDERLKENIVDASSQLNTIKNIQVREFDWKVNGYHEVGMIAQELYTVVPSVVHEGGEDVTEEPWGVDYGKLTPYLIKAIQEQQTIIEDLKSRIETLEG